MTVVSLLCGLAINYGAFKTRLDVHDEKFREIDRHQERQDSRLIENERGLAKLEGSLGA